MEIQGLIKVFVMEKVAVVMDWGGTWVRAGVVDSDGNLLWHDRSLNKVGGTQSELISGAYRVLQKHCGGVRIGMWLGLVLLCWANRC
ncbi:MAG: hypothetical protein Ct9H300mP27_07340 [Chloroflexota bacterium]|nr:MAG: hypothetical protein Ct9H300mP27_07340 [Chloroflexota bacterium]